MRCSYACGTTDHLLSRRRFLGGLAAGAGAAGLGVFANPAISATLARKERQVLVVWLAGGAASSKPGTPSREPIPAARFGRSKPVFLGHGSLSCFRVPPVGCTSLLWCVA